MPNDQYSSPEQFFRQEKPIRTFEGVNYYSPNQVARFMSLSRRTVLRIAASQDIEKKLGMCHIKDPINERTYFSEDAIKAIFENYVSLLILQHRKNIKK